MRAPRRILFEWWCVSTALLLLVSSAALSGWLWRLDLDLHDSAQARAARAVDPDIVIVAIDDASLQQIGRWPWPRNVHAALIDKLNASGARAVALDLMLSEPASEDAELAAALRRHGKVVLAVSQREQAGMIAGENLPAAVLRDAAAGIGHIQIELDPDGLARSLYLHEGWQAARYPQLGLALLQVSGERPRADQTRAQGADWQREQWLRIPFAGPPGSFRQISYADVLTGAVGEKELRGKLVLVGATALGLADSVPVPTSALSRPMAGVEVHANALSALRTGSAVRLAPRWVEALYAAGVVLLLMLALGRSTPRSGLLWVLLAMVLVVLGSGWLMHAANFWLGPAAALLGCVVAYPLWSWRRLEATQRYIDDELHALTGPDPSPTVRERGIDPLQTRLNRLRALGGLARHAQQSREDMMRFVSHDVRAPLASIVSLADSPPEDGSVLQHVRRHAQSALHLVDQMFRVARAEACDPTAFGETDLVMVLDEACDEAWALARKAGTTVEFTHAGIDAAITRGSGELLRRAVGNLLSNAIKYGGNAAPVQLSLTRSDGGWQIAVRDHGPGIPVAQRTRLFQRFSRLPDAEQRGIEGIGLGLLMVAVVAERHGGTVTLDCPADGGTVFVLALPS